MNEADRSSIETDTSFLVKIQYQQNTSWQGTIQWLDGNQTRHFRSFLEMVMLIENALTSGEAKGKKIEFHTWDGKNDGI